MRVTAQCHSAVCSGCAHLDEDGIDDPWDVRLANLRRRQFSAEHHRGLVGVAHEDDSGVPAHVAGERARQRARRALQPQRRVVHARHARRDTHIQANCTREGNAARRRERCRDVELRSAVDCPRPSPRIWEHVPLVDAQCTCSCLKSRVLP
jgi:hypothetical protein